MDCGDVAGGAGGGCGAGGETGEFGEHALGCGSAVALRRALSEAVCGMREVQEPVLGGRILRLRGLMERFPSRRTAIACACSYCKAACGGRPRRRLCR